MRVDSLRSPDVRVVGFRRSSLRDRDWTLAQTGGRDFADLVNKQSSPEVDTMPVYGTLVREQSSPRIVDGSGTRRRRWDVRDKLLLSASIAVALVIGLLIMVV